MESSIKSIITVETEINAPLEAVWKCWTTPEDIVTWNNASDDWCTTRATNDLKAGGKFSYRMESKDGSFGFDFEGTYTQITIHHQITYVLGDERKVDLVFTSIQNKTLITEEFEAEHTHPADHQKFGWQSILNNFKSYVETSLKSEKQNK